MICKQYEQCYLQLEIVAIDFINKKCIGVFTYSIQVA